jgi:hypothetical protein
VDYDDAVAAFFPARPDGTALPAAVTAGSPARRLRDACEPIAMHAVWSRGTNERLAGLGLDFLGTYVWGRAASLGEPVAPVVAAAFAWFEPGLVTAVYEGGRAAVPRTALLAAQEESTTASLRQVLADEQVARVAEVADLLADAAEPADGTGRPLFSGLRERGRPQDPFQRLWWAAGLVREHRGDSHVAAALAAGLGPVEMNVLTELWLGMPLLSYTGTRGWSPEAMEAAVTALRARGWLADDLLTAQGHAARADVEDRTDVQEQQLVDALGDRLDDVCAQLDAWGARCVTAGAFPADVLKRAAG